MDKQILEDGRIITTFENDAYRIVSDRAADSNIKTNFEPKTADMQTILCALIKDVSNANSQVDMILVNLKEWADKNLIPKEAYDTIVNLVKTFSNTTTFHQ